MTKQQEALLEMFSQHPDIEARVVRLFGLVKNNSGEFNTADAAEEFLIEEINKLGREILHGWATDQVETLISEVADKKGTIKHSKKKSPGIQPSEK